MKTYSLQCNVHVDEPGWLELAVAYLQDIGYVVVEKVLESEAVEAGKSALLRARDGLIEELGPEKWKRYLAEGHDELRLPMKFDPFFFDLLENESMRAMIDAVRSPHAILRFQQGMFSARDAVGPLPQHHFHMNFRGRLERPVAFDMIFAMSEFNESSGTLIVVPGSQQRRKRPADAYLHHAGKAVTVPSGAMLVLDSTVYHRDQPNQTDVPRLGVDQQFVLPFVKQHIDYVRALGRERVSVLPEHCRRLLGWDSRVPANLDEFYVPPEERMFRPGQW